MPLPNTNLAGDPIADFQTLQERWSGPLRIFTSKEQQHFDNLLQLLCLPLDGLQLAMILFG